MMKQIISLIIFIFLFQGLSIAQYESRKGYAGISVGPSIAVGDFGSKNINLESSGFASTGFTINLNFAYRIASNFGVTAMLMIQTSPLDDQARLDGLKSYGRTNGVPVVFTKVEANSWGMFAFMPGVFASIPLGSNGKLIIEPRALVGLMTAVSPQIRTTWKEGGLTYWEQQELGAGIAFGYSVGGVFRFNVSDRFAFLLNADYVKTNPKFIDVIYNYSDGYSGYGSFQQKIEIVNVSVGCAIRIKKDVPPVRKRFDN